MPDREGGQNRWSDGCLTLLKVASGILLVASLIYLAVAGANYAVLGAVFFEGEQMGTVVTIVYALVMFVLALAAGLLGMRATYDPSKIISFCIAAVVMVIGVLAGMASGNFGYPDSAFGGGIVGGLNLFFGVIALVSAGIGAFVVKPEVLGSSTSRKSAAASAADADDEKADEADAAGDEMGDEGSADTGELADRGSDEAGDAADDTAEGADAADDESADADDEDEPPFQPAPVPSPRGDVGSTPLPKVARTAMSRADENAPAEDAASDSEDAVDDDDAAAAATAAEVPTRTAAVEIEADDAVDLGPITSFAWEDADPEDALDALELDEPEGDADDTVTSEADAEPEGADEADEPVDTKVDEQTTADRPSTPDAEVAEIEWVDFGAGRDTLDDLDDEESTGLFGKHRRR